jgi:hypothetical protein
VSDKCGRFTVTKNVRYFVNRIIDDSRRLQDIVLARICDVTVR